MEEDEEKEEPDEPLLKPDDVLLTLPELNGESGKEKMRLTEVKGEEQGKGGK